MAKPRLPRRLRTGELHAAGELHAGSEVHQAVDVFRGERQIRDLFPRDELPAVGAGSLEQRSLRGP
jgi:hypothetical protein